MEVLDLAGVWEMREADGGDRIEARLPGCQYLSLMAAGLIENPFWGRNEKKARKPAEKTYVFRRGFIAHWEILSCDHVELFLDGADTFASVELNGQLLGRTDDAFRAWRFPCKEYLRTENEIVITFESPLYRAEDAQRKRPLPPAAASRVRGIQHIRKPAYHFGWDCSPALPPSGVSRAVELRGYTGAAVTQVRTEQSHAKGQVRLYIEAYAEAYADAPLTAGFVLKAPNGGVFEESAAVNEGRATAEILIAEPELWWCNGLGGQPLYELETRLYTEGEPERVYDTWRRRLGLRTVELDTGRDKRGRGFRFKVNGVPIFAKGANWLPPDSFAARVTPGDLSFYIRSAARANMNMLRVWGGGYYESDTFYDLCDEQGILVWQDCCFTAMTYPLDAPDFTDALAPELEYNVKRLRHHASLALWCGNDGIRAMSEARGGRLRKYRKAEDDFFNKTLPALIRQWDNATPYRPGSPASGERNVAANSLNYGDARLRAGKRASAPFGRRAARFCSAFGLESPPTEKTLLTFTDDVDLGVNDPVMRAHRKSGRGRGGMLLHILDRYRNPASTEDFTYLAQIAQAEATRRAVEAWRRDAFCGGALYWHYNDCWPAVSCSGIDYGRGYKALQYMARNFFAMLCVSADIRRGRTDLYVVNDYPAQQSVTLSWRLKDFDSWIIAHGERKMLVEPHSVRLAESLKYSALMKGKRRRGVYLVVELTRGDRLIGKQTHFLVKEKHVRLRKGTAQAAVSQQDGITTLRLTSRMFMRHVYVKTPCAAGPLSDNFFDLESGIPKKITFVTKDGVSVNEIEKSLLIRSLTDVGTKGSALTDFLIRAFIRMLPRKR